jgi:FHS family L-fucose permease-like MFS transporter
MGAVMIALLGSRFILSGIEHTPAELTAMTQEQLLKYRVSEANMVNTPYLVITGIFLFVALLIFLTKLPEINEISGPEQSVASDVKLSGTLAFGHLIKGVVAQFFYVGAQVGVASFIIRFAEYTLSGTHEKAASRYLQPPCRLHDRALCRFSHHAESPSAQTAQLVAGGSLVCLLLVLLASGQTAVWAIVLIGFFHSIMFPKIFALSLKNLGSYTKLGSSLLVMSIIGGAIVPAIMGRISDAWNIQRAFVVPLICHGYVFYFAMRGYRPSVVAPASEVEEATILSDPGPETRPQADCRIQTASRENLAGDNEERQRLWH